MKISILNAIIIAVVMGTFITSNSLANTTQDDAGLSYTVTIKENNPKVAQVRATFIPSDNNLYMFAGANRLENRWAEFVSNMTVHDENGDAILLENLGSAMWSMDYEGKGILTLEYQVNLNHEDHSWSGGIDGAAYAKDWGVFYTGRSLFVVNGDAQSEINVSFDLPETWKVSTPWLASRKGTLDYSVNNLYELQWAVIMAGLHEEVIVERDGFELRLAIGGDSLVARKDEFSDMAGGIVDYYTTLMGGRPQSTSSVNLDRSLVVINAHTDTDGEALGNNISIVVDGNGGPMSETIMRFIFAHEFFHLWNGKSFSAASNDAEWFKEGFSNYYTLKSLYNIGFLNEESYLQLLSSFFYARYSADSGIGTLSMMDGENKHSHWGLIYAGGMFVAIMQDMEIRAASDNQHSLDDVMREMFQEYSEDGAAYTVDDILTKLSDYSKADQTDFFKKYIEGTDKLSLNPYLKHAGISLEEVNGQNVFVVSPDQTDLQKRIMNGLFGKE